MPRTLTSLRVARDTVPYVLTPGTLDRPRNTLDDFLRHPQSLRMMDARRLRALCGTAFEEIKRLRLELARAGGGQ